MSAAARNTINSITRKYTSSIKFRYGSTRKSEYSNQNHVEPHHPGLKECRWTDDLKLIRDSSPSLPIYRITNLHGQITNESQDPKLAQDVVVKMYKNMVLLATMDNIFYESQRQGRISFYMTNTGEEGVQIGSAAGLSNDDLIYAQYRETGALLWRGFTVQDCADQCAGNCDDRSKGRQMPVHYGSKKLNFVVISSPLGTQIPQAVGAAYSFKIQKLNKISCVYFGDGCTSEGDFHAAMNFAATLKAPVIFFCRNNGYAISTKVDEQYAGDGLAVRAPGYGISAIRVDGNDIFAVYNATVLAREYALTNNKPVFIEAMTYRVGHHSTSDDSLAYRNLDEINQWSETKGVVGPIRRLRLYLEDKKWWSKEENQDYQKLARKEVLKALMEAEKKLKPNWREMFTDVYYEMPPLLREQMAEMEKHLEKYGEHYPLNRFKQ